MRQVSVLVLIVCFSCSMFAQLTTQPGKFKSHEVELSKPRVKDFRPYHPAIPPKVSTATSPFPVIKVNQYVTTEPQNEPSVAVNPKDRNNIVACYRDFRYGGVEPAIRSVGIATTTDGGATWMEQLALYGNHDRFSDPAVAVDTGGNFYVLTLDYNQSETGGGVDPSTQTVRKSVDKGLSWDSPTPIDPPGWHDKGMITVDNSPTSPYSGNVYVGWNGLGQRLTRSTDGGVSYSPWVDINRAGGYVTPGTGPDGEVYVTGGGDSIKILKSTDGGLSFGAATLISGKYYPWYLEIVPGQLSALGEPVVAVDKSNGPRRSNVYVTWQSTYFGDGDIFCSASTDGGVSWSEGVRVNNDSLSNGRDQFFPWVTVDDSGWVDVVFLDRRNDPANLFLDAFFAQSRDGGKTFKNFRLTPENSDPRLFPSPSARFGDYIGISAGDGRVVPIWTDTRSGNEDVYIATIDLQSSASVKGFAFTDCNHNGAYEAGETPLVHFPVVLVHDNGFDTAWTDETGNYVFSGMYPGDYTVRLPGNPLYVQTLPASHGVYNFTISGSETITGRDFGSYPTSTEDLAYGWNLVSLLSLVSDGRPDSNFSNALSKAYSFDGKYAAKDTMLTGYGYWLKVGYCSAQKVTGDSIFAKTINLHAGWNLVGALSVPLAYAKLRTNPPGVELSAAFGYQGGAYAPGASLLPGKGYWLKTAQQVDLMLDTSASSTQLAFSKQTMDQLNRITVSDNAGHTQSIYFGSGKNIGNPGMFELPPKPPAGSYDVRFGSQRYVESIPINRPTDISYPIELQIPSRQVRIAWKISDGESYSLATGSRTVSMNQEGEMMISREEFASLSLRVLQSADAAIPHTFSLEQNYPNPFNPVTTIQFSLPQSAQVTIKIINLLGEEVATLVSEQLPAGTHSRQFNAEKLASGIYFYQLKTEGFMDTKKLVLLK
jgi:hypothetical protein